MLFGKLVHAWLALQVSHRGGMYSIERVLSLDEFTTDTSLSSIILVCLCTPLPMVVLALSQELVPLQDPLDGWYANYGFWIRKATMCGVISYAIAVQVKFMVDGVRISALQLALISVCGAMGGLVAPLLVSVFATFPIPFTIVTMSPPYFIMLAASFRVVIGSDFFRQMQAYRKQLWRLVAFFCAEHLLILVYPAYQTLFEAAAHTEWQLLVVLLLPILKFAMKYVVTLTLTHVEDMMPETVIVTVDFFNAIYLATSMQSATSMTTVVVIMVLDFSQTTVGLFTLYRRTASVLSRLHDVLAVPTHERASLGLASSVRILCRNPEIFKKQKRDGVRIYSTLSHRLTAESRSLLQLLGQLKVDALRSSASCQRRFGPIATATAPHLLSSRKKFCQLLCNCANRSTVSPSSVYSSKNLQLVPGSPSPVLRRKSTATKTCTQTRELLRESLAALFTSECLVLTEFLEFVIPMTYGLYVLVMVRLPSAQYHIELVGVTSENVGPTARTIFVYALLEFVSFVVLAIVMQRNCGMRALSHLAFVLRTHMELVQSKMALWMVVTLAFRVVHFGIDFTFQFDWSAKRGG